MSTMRRSAFEQGITEPRYEIRHQWAGNGRGKVTAVELQATGGHLPVGELPYRTSKERGTITAGTPRVHPAHANRGLEERMQQKLREEYYSAEILG